jgi:hypothetical protein
MAAAVRWMTGAIVSWKVASNRSHMSENVREPSANSHNRLFIESKGRRTSRGARSHFAKTPSIRPNVFGIRKTTFRPLTPRSTGSFSTSPYLPHHTGALHGYCSARGCVAKSAKSPKNSPQKSVHVQMTKVSMAAVPIMAMVRVAWTRWVKFRKYHVRTPAAATTNQSPYQAGG